MILFRFLHLPEITTLRYKGGNTERIYGFTSLLFVHGFDSVIEHFLFVYGTYNAFMSLLDS